MRCRYYGLKAKILALGSAQAGGYRFRLPEFQPRDPASEPICPEALGSDGPWKA